MKKIFMIAAVTAFIAGTTSCKKDYTCTCDIDFMGITSTVSEDYEGLSKSEADDMQTACEAGTDSTVGVTCTWATK